MKMAIMMLVVLAVHAKADQLNRHKIDSLHAVLKTTIPDSVQADTYYNLAREYWDFPQDSARMRTTREYADRCFSISKGCGYKTGMGDACFVIAIVYSYKDQNFEAIEWFKKALNYRLEGGDDKKITKTLYNLGYFCELIGDKEQSIKYYLNCLTIAERCRDSVQAAGVYHNVALIYYVSGNKKEAIEYLKKAMNINEKIGNKRWLGLNYSTLGEYTSNLGGENYQVSLTYYRQAGEIFYSIDDQVNYGMSLIGIGTVLSGTGRFSEATDSMFKALAIFRKYNNKNGIAWTYNNLGKSYTQQKKFKEAGICLDSCLRLCKELDAGAMQNAYERLYQLDSASGNLAGAYTHYRLYVHLRDSLNSKESAQAIARQQMRSEYSLKEEQERSKQEKKEAQQIFVRNSILAGLVGSVLFLVVVYRQRNKVQEEKKNVEKEKANVEIEKANVEIEKERSDNLLLNILPAEVAEELKAKGTADAKLFDNATVLFTDFKSFTTISETLTPQELVGELHACFKAFDEICGKYSIEKIKTIGDAYLAVCGLPQANEQHAENVVHAALEIREFMVNRSKELGAKTFEIRIGINSGSVVAGIVGVKKFAYDIWGDTVNTAARMEQNSEAGKINISETTYALVKNQFTCEYRGEIDAKNKGMLKMYFVEKP